jgi:hypothetical protein
MAMTMQMEMSGRRRMMGWWRRRTMMTATSRPVVQLLYRTNAATPAAAQAGAA